MKKYSLDHINHQIIVTKNFMKAAGIVGSADYKEMLRLRREMPDYEIVERTIARNPNKQSYLNLSFERMEAFIITKEGKESDTLAEYQRECELAKIHNSPYNHVKKWFLERYKDEFTTETAAAN